MEQEIKPMKPILFSTEMVRAILDGRKTVTRRLVKPQPICHGSNNTLTPHDNDFFLSAEKHWLRCRVCGHDPEYSREGSNVSHHWKPPYSPGDILYVRETWRVQAAHRFDADVRIEHAAGGPMTTIQFPGRKSQSHSRDKYDEFIGKWADDKFHPSIHMPKEAARIFLRVTDVRVERLREITEEKALAEGIPDEWPMAPVYCPHCKGDGLVGTYDRNSLGYIDVDCPYCEKAIIRFSNLWDSTIKKAELPRYGWDANPWVWVIEFEKISKEESIQ